MSRDSSAIGKLKGDCCGRCNGSALLELDHDDELLPGAVESVADAITAGCDFCYSDFAMIVNGQPGGFDPAWGWSTVRRTIGDRELLVSKAHPMMPPWLLRITHSPHHLRAWSTEFYRSVGGHSPMSIGDDYDLLLRTYLESSSMRYVPECLYAWHVTGGNNSITRSAEVAVSCDKIYSSMCFAIYRKWAKETGRLLIDFGGLRDGAVAAGFSPADWVNCPGVAHVFDPAGDYPFGDGSLAAIRMVDVLHRLADPLAAVNECWRVLAPGGVLLVEAPDPLAAWSDPLCRTPWGLDAYLSLTEEGRAKKLLPWVESAFMPVKASQSGGRITVHLSAVKGKMPWPMRPPKGEPQ